MSNTQRHLCEETKACCLLIELHVYLWSVTFMDIFVLLDLLALFNGL